RRRHTSSKRDWSSDVCSSDLLVDVSQEVIIREDDCGTDDGIEVSEIEEHVQVIETFAERVHGRYPTADIKDPETGEVLFTKDTKIGRASCRDRAAMWAQAGSA